MKLRRFTSAGVEMNRQFLAAVHEVKQTYSDSWTFLGPDGAFDLGDIYLPMGDSDPWGDWDCRDWPTFCEDAMAPLELFGSNCGLSIIFDYGIMSFQNGAVF